MKVLSLISASLRKSAANVFSVKVKGDPCGSPSVSFLKLQILKLQDF
jgi:hypothetical protein